MERRLEHGAVLVVSRLFSTSDGSGTMWHYNDGCAADTGFSQSDFLADGSVSCIPSSSSSSSPRYSGCIFPIFANTDTTVGEKEEEEEEGNLGGKLDFSEERLPVSQSWHIATSSHFSAALRHPGTPPGCHTLSHSDWNFVKTNKLRLGREIKDINLVGWLSLSAELNYFPISCSSSSFSIGELGRANVNQRSPC